MAKLFSKFVFFIAGLSVLGCGAETGTTYDLAILNGKVIALETGKLQSQHLFISKGRISKITGTDVQDGWQAHRTIDAKDKFILPGFWDNHVHFRGGDSLIVANKNFLKLFIANGITTVRDAGGDLTPSVMTWKNQIEKGELIGPTIFTSGPKIDGPNATWAGSLVVDTEADIETTLDSLENIPVDFVKLYDSQISGENYLKTIAEAEKRGLTTSGHMPFSVTLDETVAAGIDAIEHLYYVMKGCSTEEKDITKRLKNGEIGFWEAMPALRKSYSDTTAQNTFATLRENGVYVVPTLHIGKVLSYLDETDHSNDPYLKYMGEGITNTYQGRINSAMNASEKARADRKDLDVFFGQLAKSLYDADVKLLAGSDSGAYNSYTYPGISLHQELEQMVANGIAPLDALRTSAYNGSEFLGQQLDFGSVAVGKQADLVLLEDNPLEEISNTRKIHTVVKGHSVFDKNEIQELLYSAKRD